MLAPESPIPLDDRSPLFSIAQESERTSVDRRAHIYSMIKKPRLDSARQTCGSWAPLLQGDPRDQGKLQSEGTIFPLASTHSCSLLQPAFAAAPRLGVAGHVQGALGFRSSTLVPGSRRAASLWGAPRRALQIIAAMNTALVFLKPHAANDAVTAFAKKHLDSRKVSILKEGVLKAEEMKKGGIIDTHYAALAASAVITAPLDLAISAEKKGEYASKYGSPWDEAAKSGTLLNLAQFQAKFPSMGVQDIEAKWRSGPTMKIAPGNYVSKLEEEGVCVVNGFYGSMREKFTAAGVEVRWFLVEFDEAAVPWKTFRGDIIGSTDPTAAAQGSLRRLILEQWRELGLEAEPSTADNGVHASAGPLEGLKERMTWLGSTPADDPYAQALAAKGVKGAKLDALVNNGKVLLTAEGEEGPAFDLTEDLDSSKVLDLVANMP